MTWSLGNPLEIFMDICVFLFTLTFIVIIRAWYNNRQLPPGPWGYPLLGYLPRLTLPPEVAMTELSKIYGNVLSLTAGSKLVVILSDYEAIKEALVKQGDIFNGRPKDFIFKISEDENGLITSEGEHWQRHRKFAMSMMREYGMGKLSLEAKILEEIQCCLKEISNYKGSPIDMQNILGLSVANNVTALEFGKRCDYSDKSLVNYYSVVEDTHKLLPFLLLKSFYPWINYLPNADKITKYSLFVKTRSTLDSLFQSQINCHEENYTTGSQIDYIDAYLTQRNELIQRTGNEGFFDKKTLEGNLLQLFAAGVDTVTNTIRWALLFMMAYPDIQRKVQQEIDDVVGMQRIPSMTDRSQMPYTEATLMEVSRCGSVVPFNVVRCNTKETVLFGYRIPKRTYILSNLFAIHHDPKHWKNPECFNPLRFINDKGELKTSEYLLPFSLGKRSCLGEAFARMELFLYFTSILQRFTISSPEGVPVSFKCKTGIVRSPLPYKICAFERPNYEVT